MRNPTWSLTAELDDDAQSVEERPAPTLVSLHFLRTALRRRLWACVAAAVLGVAAAGAFMVAFPPPHVAKSALVLTHDQDVDPSRAMATNVSLLQTRTVSARTVERLGLAIDPEDFLKSLQVEAASSELIVLTLAAPTDAVAVHRLTVLTEVYLEFRAEQLSLQSTILIEAMQERIKKLEADVATVSRQIDALTNASGSSESKLADAVSTRAYLTSRIDALQQSVEEATLRNSAVVASSRVIDPPVADAGRAKRTIVLGLASGLIGGAALGCGTVIFLAITSDRLRRRADIASALGVDVAHSVGRITQLPAALRWLPFLRQVDSRRTEYRQRLAQAIEDELPSPHAGLVAVAGIDNSDEVGAAVAQAAARLAEQGGESTVLDLTEQGSNHLRRAVSAPSSSAISVLRPRGLPALARDAADLRPLGQWDDEAETTERRLGDLTLVLADLDPAVGADHLATWTDHVIVVVTAGRTSVEKIRAVGDMVRAAGLDLRFAVVLHTERTDGSSGRVLVEQPAAAAANLTADDDVAVSVGKSEAR